MTLLKEENFKTTIKGKKTGLYTLKNKNGLVVQITNFGAKIASIIVPDKKGNMADIVLGYDTIDEYISGHAYYGAICGRYANRIAEGKITIEGNKYELPVNNGSNHLHGGSEGFNNQVFDVDPIKQAADGSSIRMSYLSIDGEMGYPGNLTLHVTYTLTNNNELRLEYEAVTDKTTYVNICSHSYFNLAGEGNGDILNHILSINAEKFTPVDVNQIPTGNFLPVKGTPMDFANPTVIGTHINEKYDQLDYGKGYDHNWVLNKKGNELSLAAVYYEPITGRVMEVFTTQPGVQLYTGNWIENDKGKGGKIYNMRFALCLETQNFPDSPNKPGFPSTLLKPGDIYRNTCTYKFSVK